MNHLARKKLTEAKLKKAFRMKLFELCKTRTKKSNPDLFNFYVISLGHDMSKDVGTATACKRQFQSPVNTNRTYFEWRAFWKNGFKPKNQKIQSSYGEQNNRTKTPWKQKLNMNLVARKKLTEAKSKKAFRTKLFELCKTRTKKSNPDLFKFYVMSAGHGMANDDDRATTCRRSFKAPWLQTERTMNEGPSEKTSSNGEQLESFKPKNQKIQSSYGEQKKRTTTPWKQKLNMNLVARKKLTEAKLKKAFRTKLFELCKTRTKKSSPDLFNFNVISAIHDMANDNDRATTCRRNFKATGLHTERTKNEGPSEKMSFNGETVWRFQTKKFNNSTPPMENKTKEPQDPRGKNRTRIM